MTGAVAKVISPDATFSGGTLTGGYTQYTYDGRGNVATVIEVPKAGSGLSNLVTTYNYPTSCVNKKTCNKPTSIIDPANVETDYTYDSSSGNVASVTGPIIGSVASQTRYTYSLQTPYIKNSSGTLVASNQVWRLTSVSTCMTGSTPACIGTADEKKSFIAYGGNNILPTSITLMLGDGTLSTTQTYTYDVFGNIISVDGPLPGSHDTIYYFYDSLKRKIGEIRADPGTGVQRMAYRTTYNSDGQISKIERGATSGPDASALSTMTVLDSQTTGFASDSGLPIQLSYFTGTSTTPQNVTQTTYDSSLRKSCVAQRLNPAAFASLPTSACTLGTQGTDGPDQITKYNYDTAATLLKTSTAFGTAQQADSFTKTINTSSGTTATLTDAKGNLTTFTYDGFNRLIKACMPTATNGGVSSTTDCTLTTFTGPRATSTTLRDGLILSYAYDAAGRLNTKSGTGVYEAFSYDNFGQVKTHTNNGLTETYTYNALGQLLSDAQPLGTVTYAYDAYGRRSRINYPSYGGIPFYVGYGYADDNTILSQNVSYNGGAALNVLGYVADSYRRLTNLNRGMTPYPIATSFGYDASSRISSITNDIGGTAYDNSVNLTYTQNNQFKTLANTNVAFDYSVPSAATLNNGINGLNQVSTVSSSSITYDLRGNLYSDGSTTYTYDANNLLTSTSSGASLSYDPENRLLSIAKTVTTKFLYDGTDIIAEYNGSGTLLRRYIHGAGTDQPLVQYEGTDVSQARYLVADQKGSITGVTDSSGNSLAANTYDGYGVPSSGNLGRFQYTGQAYLSEIGLYYYKARLYSPTLGRFMQPDPIGYGDGMNVYSYAHGNPINEADPTGLAGDPPPITTVIVTASTGDFDSGGSAFKENNLSPGLSKDGNKQADSITTVTVTGRKKKKPDNFHSYRITTWNPNCSADEAFSMWKQPLISAPGAPGAKEGFTARINLWGFGKANPISQSVDSKDRTIVNTTLPGHDFYPGTVTITVISLGKYGSISEIEGTGEGQNPLGNDAAGYAFFGASAGAIAYSCSDHQPSM